MFGAFFKANANKTVVEAYATTSQNSQGDQKEHTSSTPSIEVISSKTITNKNLPSTKKVKKSFTNPHAGHGDKHISDKDATLDV